MCQRYRVYTAGGRRLAKKSAPHAPHKKLSPRSAPERASARRRHLRPWQSTSHPPLPTPGRHAARCRADGAKRRSGERGSSPPASHRRVAATAINRGGGEAQARHEQRDPRPRPRKNKIRRNQSLPPRRSRRRACIQQWRPHLLIPVSPTNASVCQRRRQRGRQRRLEFWRQRRHGRRVGPPNYDCGGRSSSSPSPIRAS